MGNTLIPSSRPASVTLTAGSTTFFTPGCVYMLNGGSESSVQITWRTAGIFSNLYTKISTNTTVAASTVHFRINSTNGNQIISIPAGTTGDFQDFSDSDSVASGNLLNYGIVVPSGGGTLATSVLSMIFSATSGTTSKFLEAQAGSGSLSTASVTEYIFPAGLALIDATESRQQFKSKTAATFENLYLNISTNARTASTTLGSRHNSATGNLIISVAAAATGIFEDLTNSDTLAVGDLFNYYITTSTGTGLITISRIGADFTTLNSKSHLMIGGALITIATSTTDFFPVGGELAVATSEATAQIKSNFIHTGSNMECHLSANTISAASTVHFRKNGSNGSQTISIAASTSGYFEDIVNTDSIGITDEINYALTTGATGTSLILNNIGYLTTAPSTSVKWQACGWSYPV